MRHLSLRWGGSQPLLLLSLHNVSALTSLTAVRSREERVCKLQSFPCRLTIPVKHFPIALIILRIKAFLKFLNFIYVYFGCAESSSCGERGLLPSFGAGLCLVAPSCPSFFYPVDYSPPGASVHGDFPRQEYWSGLPCPPPGDLPNPGIEPRSPTLQAGSSPSEFQC